MDDLRKPRPPAQTVSPRWLLAALGVTAAGALLCAWLTLCLLYWQGSWQLLYHPSSALTRTPASAGLAFEPIRFATAETGAPQLAGWWLPASGARFTVLFLHGAGGNLSDSVDTLAVLHNQNLAVFAFDYRAYGQSLPLASAGHPSEKKLLQDAGWALDYLTQTRHINLASIVVYGDSLGADVAAELAAQHASLAGVILAQPPADPMAPVFADPRSHLVPAHLLVADRYNLPAIASQLRLPSLWLMPQPPAGQPAAPPPAYRSVPTAKTLVWLNPPPQSDPHFAETLHRWLDDLPAPIAIADDSKSATPFGTGPALR